MSHLNRVIFSLAIAAMTLLSLPVFPAHAEEKSPSEAAIRSYPNRPIKIVIPFGAGSAQAAMFIIGDALTKELGQPIVQETKPGDGGRIGAAAVNGALPDGYTIGYAGPNMLQSGFKIGHAPYDLEKIKIVGFMADFSVPVLVVPSSFKGNFAEFTDWAKKNPERMNWGSTRATTAHINGLQMWNLLGAKSPLHIPFKAEVEVVTGIMTKSLESAVVVMSTARSHVASGSMRALAVLSSKRSPFLPDVPSMAEVGVGGYKDTRSIIALVMPPGTPDGIIKKFRDALDKALADADVAKRLATISTTPLSGGPEVVKAWIKEEDEIRGAIMDKFGLERQ